jgi:hypothetical protein
VIDDEVVSLSYSYTVAIRVMHNQNILDLPQPTHFYTETHPCVLFLFISLIIAEGLSPYLGNFHYGEKKKPYLAFDLMEEFRSPIVDSLMLTLFNQSILKSKDFESLTEKPGIYLTEQGR